MTNFSETLQALQTCLETQNAKKFELEKVDGELQTVFLTPALIVSFFTDCDEEEPKEIISSYPLTPSGISDFVQKHDAMFFERNKKMWVEYKLWTELVEYLAQLAPNTNFAVDYHEMKHHHFGK